MSIGTTNIDSYGGQGAFGGFGGGVGLIGLIGINNLLGQNGFGNNAGVNVLEQNVSELRKDVAGVNTTVEALGGEIQSSLAMQNLSQAGEFRNLDNRLCDSEKTQLQSAYAQSLQAFQNTQSIQNQVTAFQVANDQQFCQIKQLINSDGDATRALINQNTVQDLRDQLAAAHRRSDATDVSIAINNTNQQTQSQFQAQNSALFGYLDKMNNQIAKSGQDIINVGGLMSGIAQTANPVNVKS